MRARVPALLLVVLLAGACFPGDENITPQGKGKPRLEVDFPASAEAGSKQLARFTVSNPGPGDMPSVVIAFAFVGPAATEGSLPPAIVGVGTDGANPAIARIDPSPSGISPDGVVFVFDGLDEGEETTIEFELVIPHDRGPVANSVTVYDGSDPGRAAGTRLETTVR